jgi:hypothetical protein
MVGMSVMERGRKWVNMVGGCWREAYMVEMSGGG